MQKIYFVLVVLILLSVPGVSQNFVDDHYSTEKAAPENTVVFVSGRLFELASQVIPENEEIEELGNVRELATNVTSFNLVLDRTSSDPKAAYQRGISKLSGDFEELITIREENNNVSIYVDEEDGIVYELVGIGATEDNEFLVFSLTGAIDLDQIGKIISKIENERTDKITTRSQMNIDDMKIYPNPSSKGQVLNIEAPEEMIGGKASMYDLSGNLVQSYNIDKVRYQMNTDNLTAGKYIIRLQNKEISLQKKVLIVQ
jgi:hypothetical protein